MKKIYCVGDSHSSIFSGQNIIVPSGYWTEYSDFKIFHAGPFTAFNCNKKDVVINECNSVPKDDFILLSFGEIDMRCRVGLAEDKHANIDLIIKNYFNLIDRIDNKNIIILGVTPCIVEEPMKDWFSADETRKSIFTATRGTLVERNSYKEYFNNAKEIESLKNEIGDTTVQEYLSDGWNDNAYVKAAIDKFNKLFSEQAKKQIGEK